MSHRFAQGTEVSVEKSRAEIEKLVNRYGASQFATGWDGPSAMIGFGMHGRTIRFILTLPDKSAEEFKFTPAKKYLRHPNDREKAWEQACRSSWRALLLVIKAKLEAVECGISTIEDEFMAHTVLPGTGRTIGETLRQQISEALKGGGRVLLLPGGES